jgi:hypothetical protein
MMHYVHCAKTIVKSLCVWVLAFACASLIFRYSSPPKKLSDTILNWIDLSVMHIDPNLEKWHWLVGNKCEGSSAAFLSLLLVLGLLTVPIHMVLKRCLSMLCSKHSTKETS